MIEKSKLLPLVFVLFITIAMVMSCTNVESKDQSESENASASVDVSSKGNEASNYCKNYNMNTDFCILVDMNMHSGKKRLVVWDFKNNKLMNSGLVSHGCGDAAWGGDATKESPIFSNTPESHLSSVGKYAIGERAWSNWGINVKYWLKGLESTNSNAVGRVIVLHVWEVIPDEDLYPWGTPEG